MKFVTFVWVNSLALTCALLVLTLKEQELRLTCTNTHTQRSSILDGQMINSEGSVDTFGTAIVVAGTSSLELKYPAVDPTNITTFNVLEADDDFVLWQNNTGSRLSTLKLMRESGQWWGYLIEIEYGVVKTNGAVSKVYYCG